MSKPEKVPELHGWNLVSEHQKQYPEKLWLVIGEQIYPGEWCVKRERLYVDIDGTGLVGDADQYGGVQFWIEREDEATALQKLARFIKARRDKHTGPGETESSRCYFSDPSIRSRREEAQEVLDFIHDKTPDIHDLIAFIKGRSRAYEESAGFYSDPSIYYRAFEDTEFLRFAENNISTDE